MLGFTANAPMPYCKLIEIVIPAATAVGTTINFPQDQELDQKQITAVQVFPNTFQTLGPSGGTVCNATELQALNVTLANNTDERISQIPVRTFDLEVNAGIRTPIEGLQINMQKSRVQVTNATPFAANPRTLLIGVFYIK